MSKTEEFRCGYVTIIGEPNVGKSTLLNHLLQQKISIVTAKPQTTRHNVLGILSGASYQIVFLDTPGVITPTYLLQEVMMRNASAAIDDADCLLFIIDATQPHVSEKLLAGELLRTVRDRSVPVFLLINKVDLVAKPGLLPVIEKYSHAYPFAEIFPVSALQGDGMQPLLAAIVAHLPEHPPYYPTDIVSEANERFFVAEIIREKIFQHYQQEIPYSTTVEVVEFKERETGKTFISAEIYVERDSQKKILIGRKGESLKSIGKRARSDIEGFLQRSIYLELHVKVRANWRSDKAWLTRLGFTQ